MPPSSQGSVTFPVRFVIQKGGSKNSGASSKGVQQLSRTGLETTATDDFGGSTRVLGAHEARALFLEHLSAIEEIVRGVCRRWRFTPDQAEDFDSLVKLHLIRRDYQVLRRFRGSSQLTTYLTRVVTNLARDHQAKLKGRYRPSRIAKRLGVEAVELERLIYREARGYEEAIEIVLRQRPRSNRAQLEALIARIPVRFPRRTVPLEVLDRPWLEVTGDDGVQDLDRRRLQRRLRECLSDVAASLTAEDRAILRLRFVEGCTVAEVARRLELDQRALYPRCLRILSSMRACLEGRGFSWQEVSGMVGWDVESVIEGDSGRRSAPPRARRGGA